MKELLNKKMLTNIILSYFLVWGGLVFTDMGAKVIAEDFYNRQDYSYWLEYEDIYPLDEYVRFGESPKFVSFVNIYKETGIRWNDILHCDKEGGDNFGYYANYISERIKAEPKEASASEWRYGDETFKSPPVGSRCYLESEISVCPQQIDECKTQIFSGKEHGHFFEIIE